MLLALLFVLLTQLNSCPTTSDDPECENFKLSDPLANEQIDQACNALNFLPGCSLKAKCSANYGGISTTTICNPFSLLSNICYYDGDRDELKQACSTYEQMCGTSPSSALNHQCQRDLPHPAFPSSKATIKQIYNICKAMPGMRDCKGCPIVCDKSSECTVPPQCNLLATYSALCHSMPKMKQCSVFNKMCDASSLNPFCDHPKEVPPSPPHSPPHTPGPSRPAEEWKVPSMLMFFHTGITDYILFESFVPQNEYQYILSLIACCLMACFYEGIQAYSIIWELSVEKETRKSTKKPVGVTEDSEERPANNDESQPLLPNLKPASPEPYKLIGGLNGGLSGIKTALIRSIFRFILATLGYLLMLITMSFNIGLFFAVVTGLALGNFLFIPIAKFKLIEAGSKYTDVKEDCC